VLSDFPEAKLRLNLFRIRKQASESHPGLRFAMNVSNRNESEAFAVNDRCELD
jgi:hypothetical protein